MAHLLFLSTKYPFALLLGLSLSFSSLGQTNTKALEYLVALRKPTFEISTDFLAYTKLVLLEGLTKKSIRNKKSMLEAVVDGKSKILNTPVFNGQERIYNAYTNYFVAMENYLNRLPTVEIESVQYFDTDSARKFQEVQIQQLDLVLKASQNVKECFDMFCRINRVIGFKTSGSLSVNQKDAIKLVSYAVQVSNAVMDVRRLNQLFFVTLLEDTGKKAEAVRKEIIQTSERSRLELLAIPGFPGERRLKRTGMHNVRLYGISASGVYKKLLAFREKELVFIQKSLDFKTKQCNSEMDKDAFYDEVQKFSELVKLNRKEVKALNETRVALERSFNAAFLDFVQNRFIL